MKRRILSRALTASLLGAAFAGVLWGSIDRGAIQGTVTDAQGAVVPGAKVVVRNTATNVEAVLTTNSAGFYLASELVPGLYSLHIESQGFSALEVANVKVRAGLTTTADAQLQVGTTTQRIVVTAAAPLVENTPSNFTTSVETRFVRDIPLPGRDIQALVQLIPGVTQSTGPSGTLFGFNSQFGGFPDPQHIVGSSISANGGQAGANAWYLDGSLNIALGAENVVVNPSPDAVSEFNVVDNGLAAEYGYTSGAVVNVVLKSGTNRVHGNLYEFNRNSYFNATNPFDRRNAQGQTFLEPRVNFNNFGGTLGGPVVLPLVYNGKDRTFFFASWDVSMLHENKPTILTVPLPAERQGDFTGDPRFAPVCGANGAANCLYNPYTTVGPDPVTGQFSRTAFPTPVIPQNLIDPVAKFYVASFPDPDFLDPLQQGPDGCGIYCNNFIGPVGSSQTTHNISIKLDHTISEKNKLFGEWLFDPTYYTNYRYPWNGPTAQTQTGVNGAEPYRTINQIYALGLTSTLSPTVVNEARLNFTRQAIIPGINPNSVTGTTQVLQAIQGLNFPLDPPLSPLPLIFSGGFDLPSFGPQPWQNAISGTEAVTILDNLTKVLGKHTIKAGFLFRRDYGWYEADWPLQLNFFGDLTANPVNGAGGSALAQFLTGAVNEGSSGFIVYHPGQVSNYWGYYGQDEIRVTPNLTLNIGLRYELYGWPRERHNNVDNFDAHLPNPQVPDFLGRLVYWGTSSHPQHDDIFPAHKNDFAPRFSFSWSPFGSRKTVIRGGYAIIYSNDQASGIAPQNGTASLTAAFGGDTSIAYNGDYSFVRPAFQLSQGSPPGSVTYHPPGVKQQQEQFVGQGIAFMLQGSKDPYVEQWNFQVQRQLPADSMLSVGYVGTHGTHLIGDSFRNIDFVPTDLRLKLRNNLANPVPVDAQLGPVYGCPPDPTNPGMVDCPGNLALRPWPQYTYIDDGVSPDGFNDYNSFQMKFEKRYSQGLNIIAAYTIQKNITSVNLTGLGGSNLSPTTLGGRALGRSSFVTAGFSFSQGGLEDPQNRKRYIGLSPDDIPQVLNLATIYELPVGRGKHFLNNRGAASMLLGGWTLTQNWNFQTGVPLHFAAPCNAISCTPNLIGNPSSGRAGKARGQLENQYFNPSAFEAPFGSDPTVIQEITTGLDPQGNPLDFNTLDPWWQFGNAGYHLPTGRSPGFWNADFTLAKDFHFSESRYLEFQWQVFNALNHQNLGVPNANWCLPPNPDGSVDAIHIFGCQFGKITSIQTDPRAMEFGLKLYW